MRPYLRAANVKPGALDLGGIKEMNFTPREQVAFGLRDGDVLITEGCGSLSQIGASVMLGEVPEQTCFQNTLLRARALAHVDPRFLHWWTQHAFGSGLFASIATGASIFHLSAERVRGLPFLVPPLDEQRRIADLLDAETLRIDRLSDHLEAVSTLLHERRWACVHEAVSGHSDNARLSVGLGWVDSLPASWPLVPLKYLALYGSGHTPSRTHPEYWVDCDIPWISLFDVGRMRDPRMERMYETTQKISELGVANSSACVHPAETVVLSRTASVGFATIMGRQMAVSQHFATWTCGPRLLPEFLLHVLRAMKQTWESLQVGTTNVTVFMPDLLALRVPLPSLDEQRGLVAEITRGTSEIDEVTDRLDRQRTLLAERRQVLITAAVTGQLDVTPASGVV